MSGELQKRGRPVGRASGAKDSQMEEDIGEGLARHSHARSLDPTGTGLVAQSTILLQKRPTRVAPTLDEARGC
jgi:hypothetical protein